MNQLGIYVHIPFCSSKCGYCDFYSVSGYDELMDSYQRALFKHIKETGQLVRGYNVDSIYIGGGTPTHFGAKRISALLEKLQKCFNVSKDSEITVEANPESTDFKGLCQLIKSGANRISIGIQSACDSELKALGRRHTFTQATEAVVCARHAGFNNISVDLMYGLPQQTEDRWKETLAKVTALHVEHISFYGMKLGDTSPMMSEPMPVSLPCDDTQAQMYLDAVNALSSAGFEQYEISNAAKPGRASRHNMKYWNLGEYLGIGAAAHSDFQSRRYSNVANVCDYISGINGNDIVIAESEVIGIEERALEYLMLRLRTAAGINENEYFRLFHSPFTPIEETLMLAEEQGYTTRSGDSWRLTPEGFLISNNLISTLIEKAQIGVSYDSSIF